MVESTPMLPQVAAAWPPDVCWFSGGGCVVEYEDAVEVSVGGVLVGRYARGDRGARNAILVGLAADPRVHLGQLALAFGLSEEQLRLIRRRYERDGLRAVVAPPRGRRSRSKITPALRRRLYQLFHQGKSVSEAHAVVGTKWSVGRATVGVARKEWAANSAAGQPSGEAAKPAQPALPLEGAAKTDRGSDASPRPTAIVPTYDEGIPTSSEAMQHAGSWLLLGLVERYDMHGIADEVAVTHGLGREATRLAFDAFTMALAIGEGCVEGVRRLATPSAPRLLRTPSCPSADWVRETLHRFADVGATRFHLGMAGRYLAAARENDGPAVYYVDNHMRHYTGQAVIRKGWRMQDKRVLPGTSDYYVHDEDGRPALRSVSPSHPSLTEVLPEIAGLLRAGLGEDRRILLSFDRGGAFPEVLAALRNDSYEFVTYERRPYRLLLPSAFTRTMKLQVGENEFEEFAFAEFHVALGRGRGDVRRIAIRTPEGRQVNLLAIGPTPAERLVEIQRGRWNQENAFKHGVERWGINQLDGRRTESYAPDTIVPNPARRRLDDALRLACVDEGMARRILARLDGENPKHAAVEAAIADALARQHELTERRRTTPRHAPLCETELAGKLVFHVAEYKTVLDTVRIAAANAETDLAEWLAPHLPRAAEAKKTLANLLVAPGRVEVGARTISIDLAPAGTAPEHRAFGQLYRIVNSANLRLPGDPARRVLRFGSQL